MKHGAFLMFLGALALCWPESLRAQEEPEKKPKFLVKVESVRVGFRSYNKNEGGQFKLGMWTPVFVDVRAGQKGVPPPDSTEPAFIKIESEDSDGVGTIYKIPVRLEPNETRTFIAYTKPGNHSSASKIDVTLHAEGKTFVGPSQFGQPALQVNNLLTVSLGSQLPDLPNALIGLNPRHKNDEFGDFERGNRLAGHEPDPQKLPDLWFGYMGVDLMFLSTSRKEFLNGLNKDRARLKALAQYVRRGGRLVIPVAFQNQAELFQMLRDQAWQPPVPVVPPNDPGDVKASAIKRLGKVELWGRVNQKPFTDPGGQALPVARLDPGNIAAGLWEVLADTEDGRPLIARVPYGLGSITYLAFPLDSTPFTNWEGRLEFLRTLVSELSPHVLVRDDFPGREGGADLTTDLQRHLDNFDVSVVPFGYVALFIIIYIIIVGPLDYFILKYVFKKLEWTWITFPTVVLTVSIAAYFTAYALKGNDLKINKVDVVDFDLRTDLDEKQRTKCAFASGHSFFTLLSPRIQNYTVGLEPNPAFWGAQKGEKPLSADQVSWLGRPEVFGPGGMGRGGSQGFFRRPYSYAEDATGLLGVPIPVWTTKAFTATWESAALPQLPLHADLVYHTVQFGERDLKLGGTLKNNLPQDLEDVIILFGNQLFPIKGGLVGTTTAGAEPTTIAFGSSTADFTAWTQNLGQGVRDGEMKSVQGQYNPTTLIKVAMFFEKTNNANNTRNHAMRLLDQSWRLQSEKGQGTRGVRDAVIYARVRFQRGQGDALNRSGTLPTNLWLGELPAAGGNIPTLAGTMAQDTYVRFILPVRHAD